MAGKPSKPMTPFDKSVTPSYLYNMKLLLSFLPPSTQRFLAIYIKFFEFRYTMDFFQGLPFHTFSFQSVEELMPYMDENERNMMGQMSSVFGMMDQMQSVQSMMSGEEGDSFQSYMDFFDQKLSSVSPDNSDAEKGDSEDE